MIVKEHHASNPNQQKSDRADEGRVAANVQLPDHERMHRATSHIAAKTERAWLICSESECLRLAGVSLHGNSIPVYIDTMDHVGADELNCHRVAAVHRNGGW